MFGYGEENCDKLEFNECEDDEYRCLNGMCIPDQYFLDGEYDCADLTDEKGQFNDVVCTFQEASYECDDRLCFPNFWSCGDGQCIHYRLDFNTYELPEECNSLCEQYHMCELHRYLRQWTLPNGKCYQADNYEEIVVKNRTDSEECIDFVKCALSIGAEKNCPCKNNLSCMRKLKNRCTSSIIQYPNGAIIAPYAFSFYHVKRDWANKIPDGIKINGTIKCRGYMTHQQTIREYPSWFDFRHVDATLCTSESNISLLVSIGYDEFCYNDSQIFNNRSYNFIDICEESKECISSYRFKDGYPNCADGNDEFGGAVFPSACSNIYRHRFRCSNEKPTCLTVNLLGDSDEWPDFENENDERWMGGDIELYEFFCDTTSKNDCEFIRQYVEASAKIDANITSDLQLQSPKIPFRAFCDTFWNLDSKKDEDIGMCQIWWKCPENQWQCRSGQCTEIEWVLDGEWDCVDASDEQGLFVSINHFSDHNLNSINNEELIDVFNTLYSNQPFWKVCNFTMEYPCFRANVSDPLNITQNRPCINLH